MEENKKRKGKRRGGFNILDFIIINIFWYFFPKIERNWKICEGKDIFEMKRKEERISIQFV